MTQLIDHMASLSPRPRRCRVSLRRCVTTRSSPASRNHRGYGAYPRILFTREHAADYGRWRELKKCKSHSPVFREKPVIELAARGAPVVPTALVLYYAVFGLVRTLWFS